MVKVVYFKKIVIGDIVNIVQKIMNKICKR